MRRSGKYALGLTLWVSACAHGGPGLPQAVHLSRQALHGVAIAGEASAQIWKDGVEQRVAYCRAQKPTTSAERLKCMGHWGRGDEWGGDLEQFKDAYDGAAEALKQLEKAAAGLQAFIEKGQEQ